MQKPGKNVFPQTTPQFIWVLGTGFAAKFTISVLISTKGIEDFVIACRIISKTQALASHFPSKVRAIDLDVEHEKEID